MIQLSKCHKAPVKPVEGGLECTQCGKVEKPAVGKEALKKTTTLKKSK